MKDIPQEKKCYSESGNCQNSLICNQDDECMYVTRQKATPTILPKIESVLLKHCIENKVNLTSNEFHTVIDFATEWSSLQNQELIEENKRLKEDKKYPIEFIEWHSGMERYKIERAYERYLKEIEQGQP